MKLLLALALITFVTGSQSCRTSKVTGPSTNSQIFGAMDHPTATLNRYYVITYNQSDPTKYTEREVFGADSIAAMKAEFQQLIDTIHAAKTASALDTVSKYRLKFISEQYTSKNLGSGSGTTYVLKKCGNLVDIHSFVPVHQSAQSYWSRYLVYNPMMVIETGNTYVRSSAAQYYFEKAE